jgi:hypothetical protein
LCFVVLLTMHNIGTSTSLMFWGVLFIFRMHNYSYFRFGKMWRYQKGKQKLLMEGQTIQWRTRKMTKGQAMIFKTLHIYNEDWETRTPLNTFKIIINITICIRCGVQPIDRRIVLFLSRWFWININKIMKTFIDIWKKERKKTNKGFFLLWCTGH